MNSLIVFLAAYLYVVIAAIAVAVLLFLPRRDQYGFILTVIVAFPVAYVLAKLLNHVVYSPRPFVVESLRPLVSSARDNGFPSDHTLLSMTIALVVLIYRRWVGWLLVFLALGVGTGRVLAHVHHPIDIVGSVAIAAVAVAIAITVQRRLLKHRVGEAAETANRQTAGSGEI